jgi:DNA-binding transcriptional LysR family regulator
MNFDVNDLALLEAIEECGSFSAASEKLYRTRSAITQHVQKLEDQLGFLIFNRREYRPSLTPEGRLFLERGRPLLRNFERLKAEVQHIKQGWESEFTIAIDDVFSIENLFFLIDDFRKVAPQVTIRILREVLNGCWDALVSNRANLVIGATGDPPLDLICGQQILGTVEFVFAVAKGHPLTNKPTPLLPEDLLAFPTIIVPDTSQIAPRRTSGVVSHQPRIIVPTMDVKIRAQVQGLGVGYLPRPRVLHLLETGQLVELALAHHAIRKGHFNIAWQVNSTSPVLTWFLEALKSKEVRGRLLNEH